MKTPPIPDKLFFKIGEVAELAGVEQHVLRYWEEEIESLKPKKNKSGQRLYQKKDVERVFEIKQLLYAEKFTVAGARKKLKQNKKKEYPDSPSGMPGVQTLMPVMLNHVNSGKLSLEQLTEFVDVYWNRI